MASVGLVALSASTLQGCCSSGKNNKKRSGSNRKISYINTKKYDNYMKHALVRKFNKMTQEPKWRNVSPVLSVLAQGEMYGDKHMNTIQTQLEDAFLDVQTVELNHLYETLLTMKKRNEDSTILPEAIRMAAEQLDKAALANYQ